MPNLVKPNLPPESAQWGRSVEQRLKDSALVGRNLSTLVNGVRATLSSLMGTVGFLNDQTMIVETVPGSYSTRSQTMESSADDSWVIESFNSRWDALIEFQTSNSGKIMYQSGSYLQSFSQSYSRVETYCGVEIFNGAGDYSDSNRVLYAILGGGAMECKSSWLTIGGTYSGHQHLTQLAPNSPYTIRTRRISRIQYDTSVGGVQFGRSGWQGTSLVVTKIGK